MHVGQKMCDNLNKIVLNIKEKTNDDFNARLDMIEMNISQELILKDVGKETYLLATCFTLAKNEKTSLC